ncbi:Hypothetical predicted protein, partial [Marmota monax]
KRILASLGDRLHDDPPQKPPRSITLREPSGNHTPPQLSPSLSQSTYTTGGSLDVPHIIMQGDARRRRNENYFDDIPRSKLERQMAQEPSGNHTPPQLSPSLSQSTYTTGGSLDVPHIIMQGDARRRRNENYFDDIPRSKLERQMAQ